MSWHFPCLYERLHKLLYKTEDVEGACTRHAWCGLKAKLKYACILYTLGNLGSRTYFQRVITRCIASQQSACVCGGVCSFFPPTCISPLLTVPSTLHIPSFHSHKPILIQHIHNTFPNVTLCPVVHQKNVLYKTKP